jgi:NAD(P)-dependent dehydrogenase (short-subunit alcohol dehydrogenase family)
MKTVLITGANSGIGKTTATTLSIMGYKVVFVARNIEKAEATKKEIIQVSGNNSVDFILADLMSLSQIEECASTFKHRHENLDILINNAGVCLPERRITEDGFEAMFQINHLSHFLLTNLMLEVLEKNEESRIINVSSAGHKVGKFDLDNLQSEHHFGSLSTYCNTKLLNILFTFELAERLKGTGVTVNTLHPGVVNTNFAGEMKGVFNVLNQMTKPFLINPEKGAATSIYLATSEDVKTVTGKYFEKCKAVEPKNKFINKVNQQLLWDKSMELSGL